MAVPVLYKSSDGSAPVLDGQAGSLITVLKACLVDGYGAKAAAGWGCPYSSGGPPLTRAVFRPGAGARLYLDVDDRGASSGLTGASGKEAGIRGYETMSAVGTGTGAFPTTAQVAAATANWRKSATADATTRAWFVIADDRSLYAGWQSGDNAGVYRCNYFGDIYSYKTGDAYHAFITARTGVNSTVNTGQAFTSPVSADFNSAMTGAFMARAGTQAGTSVLSSVCTIGTSENTGISFTNAYDGRVDLSRWFIGDGAAQIIRGYLRGVYRIVNPSGINDGDTFTGVGDFAGRSFVAIKTAVDYTMAVETTAWDTSS